MFEYKIYKHKYFSVFSCCLLVRGARRSLICDVQRDLIYHIPNDLHDILVHNKNYTIGQLFDIYESKNYTTLNNYFSFLSENEYIFWCDSIEELNLFPSISTHYEDFRHINNAIIDYDKNSKYPIENIIDELHLFLCKNVEIRFYNSVLLEEIEKILFSFHDTSVENIRIYLPYYFIENSVIQKFLLRNMKIDYICFHSSNDYKIQKLHQHSSTKVFYTKQIISNNSHCGLIIPEYFACNLSTFTESQKHNTCLNRKISIDVEGNIKNCPSMSKSYGNVRDTTLKDAVEKPGFKDMWYIHKDQIEICKDCEFRHICTDCRAYIQEPDNIYSKPAKCSYDPYTATWGAENPTNNKLHGQ
jgi:SPASM domain peptide maturase of grasp-with-spasm system